MAALVGTIQVRKDTAANWTLNNPTLLSGEHGLETDTRRVKIGDGATAWNALAYSLNPLGVSAATDILRRSDGDGRYDALGAAAAAQAASQPIDADLTAYANAADAAARRALIGAGTGNGNVSDGDTLTTGLIFPNTGFKIKDGPGDNTLTIVSNEDLTADRLLKIITNDATRTLTIAGDATISGTNTGDQTSVTGNAGTATALQTGRTIDGVTFDGTANITVIAPGTHAATSKATPVDADEIPLVDSAASNVLKKLTWANLKATLKTYFDTLYQTIITFGTGVQTALGNAVNTASGFVTQTGGDARYAPISPITYLSYASGSQAFTSTSLADVNGTSFTLGVGSYDIEWRITHDAAATTTGAFFSVNGTAVFTTGGLYGKVLYRSALTENPYKPIVAFDGGVAAATSLSTTNNNAFVIVHIKVTTGGTILLRAATEVGASAITITDVHGYAQKKD